MPILKTIFSGSVKILLNRSVLTLLLALAILISVSYAAKFYRQTKDLQGQVEALKHPQPTPDETKDLVNAVGQLIILPEGEDPSIVGITDKAKLAATPFFAKAENGDRVLIYVKARKAYLYRPSIHKLVDVDVVNLQNSPTVTPSP